MRELAASADYSQRRASRSESSTLRHVKRRRTTWCGEIKASELQSVRDVESETPRECRGRTWKDFGSTLCLESFFFFLFLSVIESSQLCTVYDTTVHDFEFNSGFNAHTLHLSRFSQGS